MQIKYLAVKMRVKMRKNKIPLKDMWGISWEVILADFSDVMENILVTEMYLMILVKVNLKHTDYMLWRDICLMEIHSVIKAHSC